MHLTNWSGNILEIQVYFMRAPLQQLESNFHKMDKNSSAQSTISDSSNSSIEDVLSKQLERLGMTSAIFDQATNLWPDLTLLEQAKEAAIKRIEAKKEMNQRLRELLQAKQNERLMLEQSIQLLRKEIGPKKSLEQKRRDIQNDLNNKKHDQRQQEEEEDASRPGKHD